MRARHLLLLAQIALIGCNACGTPKGKELTAGQLQQTQRDPLAELWALGPPDASLALVVPNLQPVARLVDDLRQAAAAAPRGPQAVAHLEGMLKAACPRCPRRAVDYEPAGVGAAEGLALFATPRGERVLAVGCLKSEAVLELLVSLLRRGDHTVRRRELTQTRGGPLTLIEGVSRWYCRRVASRLVCGSTPAVLDAALARRPEQGLWRRQIDGRFPIKLGEHQAVLYARQALVPDLWGLTIAADRVQLRLLSRPAPGTVRVPSRRERSTLLGLAEGADGLLRLSVDWAKLVGQPLRPPAALAEVLRWLGRLGLDPMALSENLTGEALLLKVGPFGFGAVVGVKDGLLLEPQLTALYRALHLLRFAQRLRSSPGPLRIEELGRETIDEQSVRTITVRLQLPARELLGLPLPLALTQQVFLAAGPDCLVLTSEREVVRRALTPTLRRPGALWQGDDRHLERELGAQRALTFWSRTLDPFSGLPQSLVDELIAEALREHRDLRDALQSARFLADLTHDVTISAGEEGELLSASLVLRPLHVDDAEHRRARPVYLRALRDRYAGHAEAYRRALGQIVTSHPTTRYAARAQLVAKTDPLTLAALVGATAAAVGRELQSAVGRWLGAGGASRKDAR